MGSRHPAIITSDGFLDPATLSALTMNHEYGAPSLRGHMVVRFRNDYEKSIARDLVESGTVDPIGKSGHSRIMMTIDGRRDEMPTFDAQNRIIVPITISSLRAVEVRRENVRDDLLTVLANMTRERRRDVMIGRLALTTDEQALSRDDIEKAIQSNRLLLPKGHGINEDGVIELPLEDVVALFCESNFDEDGMRRALRFGKHGLEGIQVMQKGRPDAIRGRQALVAGTHVSIGPYTGIIQSETTEQGVVHLAARILDGIRTTGMDVIRHLELFNKNLTAISLRDLRVLMKLYHTSKETQQVADRVINGRTMKHGVTFADVIELQQHPERLMHLMAQVSPTSGNGKPYGFLVGPGRSRELPWEALPEFQRANLPKVNAKFAASDPDYCVTGGDVPHFARELSSRLWHVGREQNEGRVCATWGFPDPETMEQMLMEGTGVFVAHDVRTSADAFSPQRPFPNGQRNDVYFDAHLYAQISTLHKNGARFYMARHEVEDVFTGEKLPPEILEWDKRGFWLKLDAKERIENIDTIIAMYGSHAKGMEATLRDQMNRFSLRLKKRFGKNLAYIHGKGDGVMYIADKAARDLVKISQDYPEYAGIITEDIFSIGVGIGIEKIGQNANFAPHAQVDFQAKDRLVRQMHMNDRATFNVFNIGGAGTLEEIAITLCSQKLHKNVPTPMIFVDPEGLANNGKHLWQQLHDAIVDLATMKTITKDEQRYDIELLQSYMAQFIHLARSYDEVADIIEEFADDPVTYYKNTGIPRRRLILAYEQAIDTYRETGFKLPDFLSANVILNEERWR